MKDTEIFINIKKGDNGRMISGYMTETRVETEYKVSILVKNVV